MRHLLDKLIDAQPEIMRALKIIKLSVLETAAVAVFVIRICYEYSDEPSARCARKIISSLGLFKDSVYKKFISGRQSLRQASVGVMRDATKAFKKLVMFLITIKRAQFSRKNFMSGLINKRRSRVTRLAAAACEAFQRPTDALRKLSSATVSSVKRAAAALSSSKSSGFWMVLLHLVGTIAAVVIIMLIL